MPSPFETIDTAVKAQFTGWSDLTALVPPTRIMMSDRSIDPREIDKAPQLSPLVNIVPGDISISPDVGSERLFKLVMPYDITIRQGSAKLATIRAIQFACLQTAMLMDEGRDSAGAALVQPDPFTYRSGVTSGISATHDRDEDKQWQSIFRFNVNLLAQLNSTVGDILDAPILALATYVASPRSIVLIFADSEGLALNIEAFSNDGTGFGAKDSGGNPLTITGASATGTNNAVTITLGAGNVPDNVSYHLGSLIRSVFGVYAPTFTDFDIDNT